ncbi:MAG: aldose 1-epimerase family protein [Rhodoglobus sp.]
MNAHRSATIRSALASATVDTVGASLSGFTVEEQSLLSAPAQVAPQLGFHGAVLAPWPNRLAHGRYTFDGRSHQLPINDPDLGHALHGLVFDRPWEVLEQTRSAVTMTHILDESQGYPFQVAMTVTYSLEGSQLNCEASWQNRGSTPAPFGLGFHPYFRPGPSPMAEWSLTVPSTVFLDSDPATALPTGPRDVSGTPFDFRTPRPLGEEQFSVAYKREAAANAAPIMLTDHRGWTLSITASSCFRWAQVFSGHLPTAALSRRGIAIEMQTCPANAFATGQDVLRLAPGEAGSASWSVGATRSGASAAAVSGRRRSP